MESKATAAGDQATRTWRIGREHGNNGPTGQPAGSGLSLRPRLPLGSQTRCAGPCGAPGPGGTGGGGNGAQYNSSAAVAGTANTGGGGGAGSNHIGTPDTKYGAAGGSGVVLLRHRPEAYNNLTLISNATTAQAAPTKADFVMTYTDGAGTTTVNTDLKAYASRDDGTTWTQLTLASQGSTGAHTILSAHDLDISSQPSGTDMRYKLTTHNQSVTKQTRVHAVSLGWS